MLKVITVTTNSEAAQALLQSLQRNGWDYECIVVPEWKGFGTKLISVYNYLKEHPEVTEFIFCDAFDVFALGTPEEFLIKKQVHFGDAEIVCSAEKGCWPVEGYRRLYAAQSKHGFSFLNSGLYYANSKVFIDLMDINSVEYRTDDQQFLTEALLFDEDSGIKLDTEQVLFNSHSFINDSEYGYENNRVQILGNEPAFIHSNGRTVDPKLDELISKL